MSETDRESVSIGTVEEIEATAKQLDSLSLAFCAAALPRDVERISGLIRSCLSGERGGHNTNVAVLAVILSYAHGALMSIAEQSRRDLGLQERRPAVN